MHVQVQKIRSTQSYIVVLSVSLYVQRNFWICVSWICVSRMIWSYLIFLFYFAVVRSGCPVENLEEGHVGSVHIASEMLLLLHNGVHLELLLPAQLPCPWMCT
jgi:hypothetical protein